MAIKIIKRDAVLTDAQIKDAKSTQGVRRNQVPNLRFGRLALATDADHDGSHICGLTVNLIERFWPELLETGFVHFLRTPVVLVSLRNKTELEFFTEAEFKAWEAAEGSTITGWTMKYYKGLSSWKTPQFAKFLQQPDQYLFQFRLDGEEDIEAIDLAFSKTRADDRKGWLETPADDFEKFIIEV